jgi:hypothetical protein
VRWAERELTLASYGHLQSEEFGDGDGLVAAWRAASDAHPAHERPAVLTALVAQGAGSAAAAGVDGDGAPELPLRYDEGLCLAHIAPPPISRGSTRIGTEPAATGGGEGASADRAVHRDAIVTRREFAFCCAHDPVTIFRVASALARWERIR